MFTVSAGCASRAEFVHPAYSDFHVQRVGVYDVENRTVYRLDDVTFGGVLQRSIFGVPRYNIPVLLGAAVHDALVQKGYSAEALGRLPEPLPRAAGAAAAADGGGEEYGGETSRDAELSITIASWQATTGSRPALTMRFRLQLDSVRGGEKLFAGTFFMHYKSSPRSPAQVDLAQLIRRATAAALSDLPEPTFGS